MPEMSDEDYEAWMWLADENQKDARDVSWVPFGIGEGMAAGHTGVAKQALGKAAAGLIGNVDLPTFSSDDYGKYSLVGTYDPEMADYSTISEDPRLMEMELAALDRLSNENGAVAQAHRDAGMRQAIFGANSMAKGREDAIRQDAERSGQSGAGMDQVLRGQSAQMGANRATQAGMDATHLAALERLQNEQALMGAAGQVRGENYRTAAANADIINRFNMFNTGLANEAAKYNLNAAQDISNKNVGQGDKSLDRKDRNAQTGFQNDMTKATATGNALQGMSNSAGQTQQSTAEAGRYRDQSTKDTLAMFGQLFGGGG
jgi:hypothetical protein